jgi:Arc/MetJ-type ribon-helix-helix transcriptional regulator
MKNYQKQEFQDMQEALRRARRSLPLEMKHIQSLRKAERLLMELEENKVIESVQLDILADVRRTLEKRHPAK